jgi:hypothetical protein
VCFLGYYGDGRRLCYPVGTPVWREYYNQVLTRQEGPPGRYGHGWVTVGDRMWLFGGYSGTDSDMNMTISESESTVLGDLHVFSTRYYMWTSYGDAADFGGPDPRGRHAMAGWGSSVYVHGGLGVNQTLLRDFYVMDIYTISDRVVPIWTDLSTLNNAPSPRFRHSMAVVAKSDGSGVLYLFGGVGTLDGSPLSDLYQYEIATRTWTQVVYTGGPRARAYHA